MQVIEYIVWAIEYIIFIYLGLSGLYIFIFALGAHFYKNRDSLSSNIQNKIAVIIPSYKEDAVILEVAKSALQQNYRSQYFDVVVIADSLKESTIAALNSLLIMLIEVSFEKSTKAKALNTAMDRLNENYDYAIILDADNIMEPDFLEKMNDAFMHGYQVVQGHRIAKNNNTSFAILDAASEEINNHIFRRGHRALGLSSGLIGSGMGFDYQLFKSMMKSVKAVGGFDKELEFKLAENNIEIEYLQHAIVFDEKIQTSSDFSNQRRRWLSTQFVYLRKYFKSGLKELCLKGNITFFDKLYQMIIPPRVLLLGATVLITLIYCLLNLVLNLDLYVSINYWLINLAITISAFLLAIPKSFYNSRTLKALLSLPSAFIKMFILLFKLKGANKNFIHTTHSTIKN